MSQRVNIGVIGVGMIGKSHLKRYQDLPDANVVAVADLNEAEAKKVAAEFKVPDAYADFRALLKRDDIQAVDVCLHNNLHAPVTIAAFEAGKHVYCEKPMAGSYVDAKAMYDAAQKTGKKLQIQMNTLYDPEHKIARRLIKEGHLGKVYYARSFGFRRRGRPWVDGYGTPAFVNKQIAAGGALFDMGIYHMAQVMDLLGNPDVLAVSGATYQELEMYADRAKSGNFSVEEMGLGHVRLKGGLTLVVEESWAVHYDGSEHSKILGSKGGLKLSKPPVLYSKIGDVEYKAEIELGHVDTRWRKCESDYEHYDSNEKHWLAALLGKVELYPTAAIAKNVALISEGIYLSQEQNRELQAGEILERSKSTALKV